MGAARSRIANITPPYRFDHPKIFPDIVNDMFITKRDAGPGDRVVPFDLPTTDGGRVTSPDPTAKPTLLVFGSRTCPVTESGAEGLKRLHSQMRGQIRFVMVNVREAHPGGAIAQPQTFEEKRRRAAELKDHHAFPFEVAVDDVDGTFHRSLGARPNSAYVIDATGTILFRAQWGNETEAIGAALSAIAAGRKPRRAAVTRTLHSMTRMIGYMSPVFNAAGKGARLDTWKVAPPMAVMMTFADLLVFLPRKSRGLVAMAMPIVLIGAAGLAAALLFA